MHWRDFNIVLSPADRLGGSPPELNSVSDFGNCMMQNGLIDLGFKGSPYTWQRPDGMKQRLDRFFVNLAWRDIFSKNTITHGILKESDHRPILVEAWSTSASVKGNFRFQNMWILHLNFLEEVQNNWNLPARSEGLKKIKEKLSRLKFFLKFWNKNTFGNIFDKVKSLEEEVATAESLATSNPSEVNKRNWKEKFDLFTQALDQEDAYWKQKASAQWCTQG